MRGCTTSWRRNCGARPLVTCSASGPDVSRAASGGSTSGIASSAISGAVHGTEKAASTSAISLPSCSIRAESVLSERPSRSITVSILTGPGLGARA